MALADNLLAYWKLDDDGSGDVSLVDSTGNGNTLTNVGGVTLGTGLINGDAVVSGGNYLSDTIDLAGATDFTYSVWVKYNSADITTYSSFIIGQCGTGGVNIANIAAQSTGLYAYMAGPNIETPRFDIGDGNWHHVSLTYNPTSYELYIDGVSVNSGPTNVSIGGGDGGFFGIGSTQYGVDEPWIFNGQIDEVGVWDRALSSTEVFLLYNSGNGRSYPFPPSWYFNASVDGNLATLGNWWLDPAFTTPATILPNSASIVFITQPVTSGTASYAVCTISANIGSSVSITASTITVNGGINSGSLAGTTTLNNSASNSGTITGATTLNDDSYNNGSIVGSATFNENAYNGADGSVSVNATFNGTEGNAGTVAGNAEFFDTTSNTGTVEGNAVFRNSSSNAGGVVEGNATIYHPCANPIAGAVMGTETYLWPNGTGLWGGDVWIDGDIAFIIPQQSDVRSGVSYGPASSPYTGTYSGVGGKKPLSLSQLLKLPFPINI